MCGSGPDYIEENEYERALFEQSEKMWQNYQDKYIPLENQAIEQMQNKRSAGYRQHSMDQGVNAARMQNPGTTQVGAGMNPGGGGAMMAANDAANLTATSGAMGAMAGLQSAEDQYTSGMLGISRQAGDNRPRPCRVCPAWRPTRLAWMPLS